MKTLIKLKCLWEAEKEKLIKREHIKEKDLIKQIDAEDIKILHSENKTK
jgi:hypothetical protein